MWLHLSVVHFHIKMNWGGVGGVKIRSELECVTQSITCLELGRGAMGA